MESHDGPTTLDDLLDLAAARLIEIAADIHAITTTPTLAQRQAIHTAHTQLLELQHAISELYWGCYAEAAAIGVRPKHEARP